MNEKPIDMTFSALVREVATFDTERVGRYTAAYERFESVCAELDRRWDAVKRMAADGYWAARKASGEGEP